MQKLLSFLVFFALGILAEAQTDYLVFGRHIYDLILSGNSELSSEYVELPEYTAYIDRLNDLPEELREEIKFDATRSYNDVRLDFESECQRILNLYKQSLRTGTTFTFSACEFEASKNFPDIGFITCYYIVNLPDEEEPEEDALRFEAILTTNGWRILDGFFDSNDL